MVTLPKSTHSQLGDHISTDKFLVKVKDLNWSIYDLQIEDLQRSFGGWANYTLIMSSTSSCLLQHCINQREWNTCMWSPISHWQRNSHQFNISAVSSCITIYQQSTSDPNRALAQVIRKLGSLINCTHLCWQLMFAHYGTVSIRSLMKSH